MSLFQFLNDINGSLLMLDYRGLEPLQKLTNSILKDSYSDNRKVLAVSNNYGESYSSQSSNNPFDNWKSGSVAIIPIQGIMLKSGSWFYYGIDEIAEILKMAYKSDKIKAVLIKGDSNGGATNSVYVIEDVLRSRNKPTYMFVDGSLQSCAMYVGSFCDKIYAINDMCSIGGLGVFARLVAPKEDDEYKIIEVYPDESHLKNYSEREAVKGNNQPLKDDLKIIATHFQNILKKNRPQVTSEDVFAGKSFYATEALNVGLIDGIKSLELVLTELESKTIPSDIQTEITKMFN